MWSTKSWVKVWTSKCASLITGYLQVEILYLAVSQKHRHLTGTWFAAISKSLFSHKTTAKLQPSRCDTIAAALTGEPAFFQRFT